MYEIWSGDIARCRLRGSWSWSWHLGNLEFEKLSDASSSFISMEQKHIITYYLLVYEFYHHRRKTKLSRKGKDHGDWKSLFGKMFKWNWLVSVTTFPYNDALKETSRSRKQDFVEPSTCCKLSWCTNSLSRCSGIVTYSMTKHILN